MKQNKPRRRNKNYSKYTSNNKNKTGRQAAIILITIIKLSHLISSRGVCMFACVTICMRAFIFVGVFVCVFVAVKLAIVPF